MYDGAAAAPSEAAPVTIPSARAVVRALGIVSSPESPAIPHYVALLRAVNLPNHKAIAMSALRDFATDLGLGSARTMLQSGNLLFETRARATRSLEQMLEAEAESRLGLRTEFLVRTADELSEVIARNPFPDAARDDPSHLVVGFLTGKISADRVDDLQAAITGRELVRGRDRELYLVYPDGIGRSRLTTALITRKVGTQVTGRNWNTVLKLRELMASAE